MAQARHFAAAGLAAVIATAAVVRSVWGEDHVHAPAPDALHDVKPDGAAPQPAAHAPATSVPVDDAVKMLVDGNARFVSGKPDRPHLGQARLCDTYANGQHPYAAVLSCADSRVPVEHVLDAGIGDLFVVRVAGNVADVDEVGTIEYGVEHLGINAILVLGHTKCGAVTAVVDGAHVTPNIAKLVDNIVPAADAARQASPTLTGPRLVSRAIRLNVLRSIADLSANSDLIRERVKDGRLKIVGGVYDLHSGEIDWLDQPQSSAAPTKVRESEKKSAAEADNHGPVSRSAPQPAKSQTSAGGAAKHDSAAKPHASAHTSEPATKHASASDPATHDAPHGVPAGSPQTQPAKKKDNFVALGSLLGGSAVVSTVLFRFIGGRRAKPSDATTAAPAPAKH